MMGSIFAIDNIVLHDKTYGDSNWSPSSLRPRSCITPPVWGEGLGKLQPLPFQPLPNMQALFDAAWHGNLERMKEILTEEYVTVLWL